MISILYLFLFSVSSQALEDDAKKIVENIFSKAANPEVSTSIEKQNEITAEVDFSALAKSALGKNARNVPEKDFIWFRDTLKEIITRTVYPKAPEFLKGVKISYNETTLKGAIASVKSTVQNKADLTDVEYKLEKSKDSTWKVIDVSISELSWVESIRDQVTEILKKKKWKGLKDAMDKRLSDIKAGKV